MLNSRSRFLIGALLALLGLFGAWLRLPDAVARERKGVDEAHYERYVQFLSQNGLSAWPDLLSSYIQEQKREEFAFLPPTRILYLGSGWSLHRLTGAPPLEALRWCSFTAALLTLLLGAIWAWRMEGPVASLGVSALLVCSPLLIHLSHRALIDGFFAFWALASIWGVFESMQAPNKRAWLWLAALGIIGMILTKENAAFAYAGILSIMVVNRWLPMGTASRELWGTVLLSPIVGGAVLVLVAGGWEPLVEAYRLNIAKSVVLPYAISTGDGPWFRYLLDFLLVSPAIVMLALSSLGTSFGQSPSKRFLWVFLAVSYLLMAQVRYGMNMRYGAMWLCPLCFLAFGTISALTGRLPTAWRGTGASLAILLVCAVELLSYNHLFVRSKVYDPVAGAMAIALRMWKPSGAPSQ